MFGAPVCEIDSRNKFRDLVWNINFLFCNFGNFLLAAFALHVGVMSERIAIIFVWMEDESLPSITDLQVNMNLNCVCMSHVLFKLLACSYHSLHSHCCTVWELREIQNYVSRSEDRNCHKVAWSNIKGTKLKEQFTELWYQEILC